MDSLLQQWLAVEVEQRWLISLQELTVSEEDVSEESIVGLCRMFGQELPTFKEDATPQVKQELLVPFKRPEKESVVSVAAPLRKRQEADAGIDPSTAPEKKQFKTEPATKPGFLLSQAEASPPPATKSSAPASAAPTKPEVSQSQAPATPPQATKQEAVRSQAKAAPLATPPRPTKSSTPASAAAAKQEVPPATQCPAPPPPPAVAPEILARAQEMQESRASKKKQRAEDAMAKRILSHAKLDFNTHFQKYHRFRVEKGHWQNFLRAVTAGLGEESDFSCTVCKQMLLQFDIPKSRDAVLQSMGMVDTESAPLPIETELEADNADGLEADLAAAMVAYEEPPDAFEPPSKRSRAGRPKRGEKIEFNIFKYLAENRPGMYRKSSRMEVGMI